MTTVRLMAFLVLAAAGAWRPTEAAAQGQSPHGWLFGAWTGGLFPAPTALSARACQSQPVVIFTRDIVLRATLTEVVYTQRVIETARTNPGATEFRFAPAQDAGAATSGGLLGLTAPKPLSGFGCEDPNVLHVQRRSDNEISFPGCPEFSYPLVRCPAK